MILFVLAILLLIAGLITGAVFASGKANGKKNLKKFSYIPTAVGGALCAVFVLLSAMTSVPTGFTGILTTFGKVEDKSYESGFHFKAPWQEVVKMDNRVQKATVTLDSFSSDIQEVKVVYTLNYQIRKADAMNIYANVGKNYYSTVVEPTIMESVKVVTAKYTAESLISSRTQVAESIQTVLSDSLDEYNIIVVSTSIEDMDFSDAFTSAVEAKQVAAQNKLQAQIEQEQKTMEAEESAKRAQIQAQANAEVAKINAEADLEVTKIQADAAEYAGQKEAAKNKAISESLTDDLIKYYYILQWNGELPSTVVGGDNISTILPIGD